MFREMTYPVLSVYIPEVHVFHHCMIRGFETMMKLFVVDIVAHAPQHWLKAGRHAELVLSLGLFRLIHAIASMVFLPHMSPSPWQFLEILSLRACHIYTQYT